MAIQAFQLFGDVELRTAKLKSGVRDADSQFKHIENHAKSTVRNVNHELSRLGQFKSQLNQGFMASFGIQGGGGTGSLLGSAAGNLLQSGARALFGHVTESIEKGMEMKDLIEQMRIAFTNLTGSEEKAVAHMREIFKFGADTPFQVRDLLHYSQGLQAVGIQAKDIKPILTDLGDAMAKAGTFPRMDKAMLAVTQMLSKGRITGEELNQQLSEALPGARGYMARGLGVSQPELNKLLEEGRIQAEAALRLMFLQMRKEAAGTMKETATKTLAGLQSTLEDNKLMTYATGVTGGDPFGLGGGAWEQYRQHLLKQIGIYSGPEAANVSKKVGQTAEWYYWGLGKMDENAFKSATGRDTIMKMFSDPKGAAADIWGGLTQGISSGAGAVMQAGASLGQALHKGFDSIWVFGSPSKTAIQLGLWINEGLEMGLTRGQKQTYANLEKLAQADPNFIKTLAAEAASRGVNPNDMLNLIGIESRFNKSVVNQWGYGGLGQVGRDERKALGLPVADSAFKQLLEGQSASWQVINVLMPFLDMKLRQNRGVTKDGVSLSELYAMWGSGHATGDPNAVHMARGGKRSKAYANNPLWDFNKDGQVQEWEFGNAAFNSLGAGKFFGINGSPLSNTNPMPVQVVDYGNAVKIDPRTMQPYAPQLVGMGTAGGGRLGTKKVTSSGTIYDPANASLDVVAEIEPIKSELRDFTKEGLVPMYKPLIDAKEAMKGIAEMDSEMEKLRKEAILPDAEKKKKKDKLFDPAFTREGIAGDFQGGLQGLFSGLGWEKPGSLAKQFGLGLLRDIQGRIAHDLSAQITGALFGNRGEDGKLTGGLFGGGGFGSLFSKLFGGLFGGFRASGGPVAGGRFYMFGERGPELGFIGPGSSGHVYNNQQTRQMIGGDPHYTIVAIGDREIGRAVDAYRMDHKGRRSRIIQGKYMRKLMVYS